MHKKNIGTFCKNRIGAKVGGHFAKTKSGQIKAEGILQKQNQDKSRRRTAEPGRWMSRQHQSGTNPSLSYSSPIRRQDIFTKFHLKTKRKALPLVLTFCRGKKMFSTIGFYCSFDLNLANFSSTVLCCQLCWDMGRIASCHF